MNTESAVLMAEDRFFSALSKHDCEALGDVVADDCVLIDVMTGSEVPCAVFLEVVCSRQLVFDSIERLGARIRLYGGAAVVTGQTRMIGHLDAQAFQVHSRYTHVYAHGRDGFRLVNAQGTPVAAAAG
jgi:ketosteroid isomerase-like protein